MQLTYPMSQFSIFTSDIPPNRHISLPLSKTYHKAYFYSENFLSHEIEWMQTEREK